MVACATRCLSLGLCPPPDGKAAPRFAARIVAPGAGVGRRLHRARAGAAAHRRRGRVDMTRINQGGIGRFLRRPGGVCAVSNNENFACAIARMSRPKRTVCARFAGECPQTQRRRPRCGGGADLSGHERTAGRRWCEVPQQEGALPCTRPLSRTQPPCEQLPGAPRPRAFPFGPQARAALPRRKPHSRSDLQNPPGPGGRGELPSAPFLAKYGVARRRGRGYILTRGGRPRW